MPVLLNMCTTGIGLPILLLYPKRIKSGTRVDYTNLNKACKKDPFGLPRIDQVVDSMAGCSLLSYLDCYSGYHQIPLKKEDQIKISFITPFGAFCYTTMSFGLKSAGATYQSGIQRCLYSQHGRKVEAYVDEVAVKTQEEEGLISDLTETFDNLRKIKMKLNNEKCTFEVPLGMLLGYMVSRRGIDPNPEKVSSITKMKPPESLHDVQKLTGCMAALSRFISRLGVRGLPFFKLLKKQDKFQWTQEAQEAFKDLKKYLTTPPTLVGPEPHKDLQLYISATSNVVSTTIVIERGELDTNRKIKYPVYFVSEVLSDSKTRHFYIMKLAYALLITARKLSHYFQSHRIEVHTSSTLGKILNNREATDKIAKWAVELSMYDIIYKQGQQSRLKCSTTSWPSGQKFKHLPRKESWSIGPSTSTGSYNFKVQEQEFW
jgi:hypothetical protein